MKNPKLVKAFEIARKYIESGEERFICCALLEAKIKYNISTSEYLNAKNLIETRIGRDGTVVDCSPLEEWLSKRLPYTEDQLTDMREEMRLYRLRWLDSLIAEFS